MIYESSSYMPKKFHFDNSILPKLGCNSFTSIHLSTIVLILRSDISNIYRLLQVLLRVLHSKKK